MELSTQYLGFEFPHPLMVGASPLADNIDSIKRAEDAGAAAIVMRSVFEEQIKAEALATHGATEPHGESFGEATSYFADPIDFVMGPDEYLEQIRKAKEAVDIPVIGSLNGATLGGWIEYASALAEAGADALELNIFHVAADPTETAATLEQRDVDMVRAVRKAVRLPVALKVSPFYTSFVNFAHSVVDAGADGLVLFNRFFEPDIDVEALEVRPHLTFSTSDELLLRLRWLAILSGKLRGSLAVTGGVHTALDAIKAIMCGAHAVQMVSALLRHGHDHIRRVRRGMIDWMQERGYESLEQMRGSMNQLRCPDPESYRRANYMRALQTWRPSHL